MFAIRYDNLDHIVERGRGDRAVLKEYDEGNDGTLQLISGGCMWSIDPPVVPELDKVFKEDSLFGVPRLAGERMGRDGHLCLGRTGYMLYITVRKGTTYKQALLDFHFAATKYLKSKKKRLPFAFVARFFYAKEGVYTQLPSDKPIVNIYLET